MRNAMKPVTPRILCPYHLGEDHLEIRCEGPFETAFIRLLFENGEVMDRHKHTFCEEHSDYCEIYRMVKYNRYCGDV